MIKKLKNTLPKTWEEYCQKYNIDKTEEFILKKFSKQYVALWKLHHLRDCYRQGWIPELNKVVFFVIDWHYNGYQISGTIVSRRFLSFQTMDIATEFYDNFYDLLLEAGDLI